MKELNKQKWLELLKKGYSLDNVYLLSILDELEDIDFENPKVAILKQGLIRRGLITNENKLTIEGHEILNFVSSPSDIKLTKKKILKEDDFSLFWSAFPSTDTFEYKGKKFTGSRALKTNKEDCKAKLKSIINDGEYTITDLVEAVKLDVYQKKEASYKTGQNKLSYIQNSLTYLRQLSFEPFIELVKSGTKVEEVKTSNTVDI